MQGYKTALGYTCTCRINLTMEEKGCNGISVVSVQSGGMKKGLYKRAWHSMIAVVVGKIDNHCYGGL